MEAVLNQYEQFIQHEKVRKGLILFLIFAFIFLFQEFFTIKDFSILYIISKVVIGVLSSLVFAVYFIKVIITKRLPEYSWYLIFIFTALLGLSTFSSYIDFNQPIIMGIISQVKLTGIFYYFFMFAILRGFKVTLKELEVTFICLGLIFLFIYIGANLTLNPQKYYTKASSIVMHDSKGYRFRFPDVFVSIFTFYSFRRLITEGKFSMFILFMLSIAYVILFSHERAYTASVCGVICFTTFYRSNIAVKAAFIAMGIVVLVWLATGGLDWIAENVDTASLDTRLVTTSVTYNFLSQQFAHFLFGGGNINELWLNGFARLYGENFFLSDIGWIGICYEFGFIGTLICLSLYVLLFVELNKALRPKRTLLIMSLRDYVFMRFVLSTFAPAIPYEIGIFTSILAVCVFVRFHIRPFKASML